MRKLVPSKTTPGEPKGYKGCKGYKDGLQPETTPGEPKNFIRHDRHKEREALFAQFWVGPACLICFLLMTSPCSAIVPRTCSAR